VRLISWSALIVCVTLYIVTCNSRSLTWHWDAKTDGWVAEERTRTAHAARRVRTTGSAV